MKVLTIITVRFGINGITNVVKNYYKFLDKNLVEMDFVLLNEPPKEFIDYVKNSGGQIFVLPERLSNPIVYYKKLKKVIRESSYDIIHAHGNSNTLGIEMGIAKSCAIPVRIAHAHNTTTKYKALHSIMRVPFEKSYTHGIACGVDAGNWLFNEKNFFVIDNGVDTLKYKYSEENRKTIRQEFNIADNEKVIGHIGHFSLQKNQKFIIDLFDWIIKNDPDNNYRVLLMGNGELREGLEALVKEKQLQNHILFLGNRNDVDKMLSAIDLLLMPSLFEGLPLTLIEAQSTDLKCLIADTITKEVDITGNVEFFDLNDNYSKVAKQIYKLTSGINDRNIKKGNKLVSESKYNIIEGSLRLQHLYRKFLNTSKRVSR